ncbi:hypothetical protein [Rickettsiales endosymbiont of Stachyamoeba lipophora]|uniref:hypothetical protein n=1 Tax=Rickettsiales endosymbiont of Stachyamoeba lipophora TaxID=2486578 RepID=UPI000F64696E|nr:hypothetical protein [Rickettsiales endosymbiont of Stachyamoeba lipophora]
MADNRSLLYIIIYLILISFFILIISHLQLTRKKEPLDHPKNTVNQKVDGEWLVKNTIFDLKTEANQIAQEYKLPIAQNANNANQAYSLSVNIEDVYYENKIHINFKNFLYKFYYNIKSHFSFRNSKFLLPHSLSVIQKAYLMDFLAEELETGYEVIFTDIIKDKLILELEYR